MDFLIHLQANEFFYSTFPLPALSENLCSHYTEILIFLTNLKEIIFKVLFMKSIGENLFHSLKESKQFLQSCLGLL